MIKEVNRKFIVTIILFALYFLGFGGLLLWYYLASGGGNTAVVLIFVFFLLTLFVSAYASNQLNYLTNLSYLYKIYDNQGEPLPVTRVDDVNKLYQYLNGNDFKQYTNDGSHYLFYRVSNDTIKKIFSMYMLEIVVYITKESSEFYLDQVNEEINAIKAMLLEDKKKVNRLFVTQIKDINSLDEKTKDSISEIVFLRTKYNIISTINIGVLDNKLAVIQYSDTYTPSLYYTYHIEQIKKMV